MDVYKDSFDKVSIHTTVGIQNVGLLGAFCSQKSTNASIKGFKIAVKHTKCTIHCPGHSKLAWNMKYFCLLKMVKFKI